MLKISKKVTPLILSVIVLSTLTILLLIFSYTAGRPLQASNSQIPIVINQLNKENGVVPVELSCGNAQLANPSEITGFSCSLKNNTAKTINSVTTTYNIITEKDGKEAGTPSYVTMESTVHPDLVSEHLHQAIPPGGERSLEINETTKYDDAVIKRVEIYVDYVEFSDMSSLGPNKMGEKIVTSMRSGASIYRNWLVQQFYQNGDSPEKIISVLQNNQPLPTGIGLDDLYFKQGARVYRSHLLDIYNKQGEKELEIIFNRPDERHSMKK